MRTGAHDTGDPGTLQIYSGSMSSTNPSPDTAPRSGTHRTRTLVLIAVAAAAVAGVLGLLVGGVSGALLSSGLGGSGSRTDQNVAEGCAILDRLEEELPVEEDSVGLSDPLIFELGAAGQLFMAAGAGDPNGELWTIGGDLVSGMSTLDVERMNDSIEAAEEICANA